MRLIDADKLIEICRKGWKLYGGEDEKLKHWVDEYDIRSQPTVKAVSVEWIEKEIKRTTDITDEKELDVLYAGNLSFMLKLWEKEHEAN